MDNKSADDDYFSESGLCLGDILRVAEKRLAAAGIENAMLDARLLAEDALGFDRTRIYANADYELCLGEADCLQTMITRRLAHEPVARILGEREFWGLPFGLNEATLEPRPDSETLIETALNGHQEKDIRVLDLGTGTGCLLLSLLHELPNATGLGIDIAPRAVEQAQKNAECLRLNERASFKVNNWLDGIDEKFDLIISNPPYISAKEIPALMPEVRDFDPLAALDGGKDGLDVHRLLIPQLPKYLNANGFVVFEVGQGQAAEVRKLFETAGFKNITTHNDLGGIERCVAASTV